MNLGLSIKAHYHMECWRQGQLVWTEDFYNIVTTVGKSNVLDATFKTGVTSPLWYVGLVNASPSPSYAAGDTMASHAGWVEWVNYDDSVRPLFNCSVPSGGSCASSPASGYVMSANGTLAGAFLVNNNVKSGTSGILHGVASFVAGSRAVLDNDVVTVSIGLSIT